MARLIFFVIVGAIGLVIVAVKRVTGEVTGNENFKKATLHSETKVVMDKTAKGINWMEEQWEQSKKTAEGVKKNKIDG